MLNGNTLWLQDIYVVTFHIVTACYPVWVDTLGAMADKTWINHQTERADVSTYVFMLRMQQFLADKSHTTSIFEQFYPLPKKSMSPYLILPSKNNSINILALCRLSVDGADLMWFSVRDSF